MNKEQRNYLTLASIIPATYSGLIKTLFMNCESPYGGRIPSAGRLHPFKPKRDDTFTKSEYNIPMMGL
jgi:hypothetical protein